MAPKCKYSEINEKLHSGMFKNGIAYHKQPNKLTRPMSLNLFYWHSRKIKYYISVSITIIDIPIVCQQVVLHYKRLVLKEK